MCLGQCDICPTCDVWSFRCVCVVVVLLFCYACQTVAMHSAALIHTFEMFAMDAIGDHMMKAHSSSCVCE